MKVQGDAGEAEEEGTQEKDSPELVFDIMQLWASRLGFDASGGMTPILLIQLLLACLARLSPHPKAS